MATGIPATPQQSMTPRSAAGFPRRQAGDEGTAPRDERGERDFLGSHRALPVCTREFDRLAAAVAAQLAEQDEPAVETALRELLAQAGIVGGGEEGA